MQIPRGKFCGLTHPSTFCNHLIFLIVYDKFPEKLKVSPHVSNVYCYSLVFMQRTIGIRHRQQMLVTH